MQAYVTTVHDPFHPARGRESRVVLTPTRIADLAPVTSKPFICLRNGQALLRKDWEERVTDGEVISFVTLPQGGGGGGSNPIAAILMIALVVFAPYAAGLIGEIGVGGGMTLGATIGATGIGYLSAGIVMAGSMLINALLPPPKPPTPMQAAALAAPSPTYSLQAQGNSARIDAAIPVQYGRLKFFPDFGAQPYAEFAGNEQYLYQLFVLGQGEFSLESINIEDTPITSFAEITYEVIPPYGTLTLFPANVDTSGLVSGQEAVGLLTGTYSQTGTTITVSVTNHGLSSGNQVYLSFTSGTAPSGAYTVATVTDLNTYTVTAATATTSGNVTQEPYLGPFVANVSGTTANFIGIDIVLSRGLYYFDSTSGNITNATVTFSVEAQQVDNSGVPIGGWSTLGNETITAATTTPQRYSYRYSVTGARYQVRLRRTNIKQTATGWGNDLLWGGLRAYLPDTRNFGNVTLLAMRMRASNNLSMQASRKVNVIATRKLQTWNPSTGWSTGTVATRSIAWALADICRASYGGKLGDARIDLAALYALDAVWTARGDTCDGRIDNAMTLWEALTQVASTGRAKPYMQGGIVRVARDQAATIPVALFSMRNIAKGSFSVDYIMPSDTTADAVEVSYFSDVNWAPQRVIAALPASSALKPAKVSLFGVVQRAQAYREGMYQAASNRYRRKLIKFSTEMEGFIPSFGDLVAVSHDMPQWGQYSEAVAWNAGTLTLTVSEPMAFATGTHYIGMRKKDGSVSGPWVVTAGATAYDLVLATAPDYTPYTGSDYERTHVVFGWGETWRQQARVVSVKPRGLYQIDIECINEDPSVHTADVGITAPAVQSSQLNTIYTAPVVVGLTGRSSPSDPKIMLLSWQQAPGADYYIIEQSNDNQRWTRSAEVRSSNYSGVALYGSATIIRVAAVGLTRGPFVTIYYGSVSDYMWNAVSTTLMWDTTTPPGDGSAVKMWL